MQKLLIATTNKGKLRELKHFLKVLPFQLVSLEEIGINQDMEEKGATYQENAEMKALYYAKLSNLPTLADDGGLEIVALHNEPGIHSRRWLGYSATDDELIEHMSKISKSLPNNNRNAKFVVVISFALPDGIVQSTKGIVTGVIAQIPSMNKVKGYPYRSFFYIPEIKKFYQEELLTPVEQNKYNHRYKAIKKLEPVIMNKLLNESR